jgi:hypothetical protein
MAIRPMNLTCKNCGALLSPPDAHSTRAFAACATCSAIVACRPCEQPASIAVCRDDAGAFTITFRWYRPVFAALMFLALIFDALMVVMMRALANGILVDRQGHVLPASAAPANLAFFGLLLTIGLVGTYLALAGVVNRTTIRVHRGVLTVRHGPLPWWGSCELATREIRQLSCSQRTTREKGGPQTWYTVVAQLSSGGSTPLITDLPYADQALFIEQELQAQLNVADARAPRA